MEKYFIIGAVVLVIIGFVVYSIIRNNKIRRNGVEADAVVSRIEEERSTSSEGGADYTYTYYVVYTSQDGQEIEAKLSSAPGHTRVGDPVRIKYLPEKPKIAILVK